MVCGGCSGGIVVVDVVGCSGSSDGGSGGL